MNKALFFVLTAFLLAGCVSTRYVPVETVIHDSVYIDKVVSISDTTKENQKEKEISWMTIHEADSAELQELGIKLDGVQKALVIERNKVRELEKVISSSTKQESKNDSITIKEKEVKVPYPVPAELTAWQSFCCDYGKVMLGCTILLLVFVIIYIYRKLRAR